MILDLLYPDLYLIRKLLMGGLRPVPCFETCTLVGDLWACALVVDLRPGLRHGKPVPSWFISALVGDQCTGDKVRQVLY